MNGRVHPETTGYITNPTFSRLCDIARAINEATETQVYRILNDHNALALERQSEAADIAQPENTEVFEMRSTGFSDENIRRHVEPQGGDITIEEENDVDEDPTNRRPT